MSYIIKSNVDPDKDITLARIKKEGSDKKQKYLCIREADYNEDNRQEKGRELMLKKDEIFVPVLSRRGFSRLYINGATGSGKSTLIKDLIMSTDHPTYMFSRLLSDPSIDDYVEVQRVNCDTLIDDPMDLEELAGHICIFDDHQTFMNDKVNKLVQRLSDQALESARHYAVPAVITTSHVLLNHNKSKQNLIESNGVCCFHRAGSIYQFRNFLKMHCGLSKQQIERVLNMKGRYVLVYRNNPPCAISPKELVMF